MIKHIVIWTLKEHANGQGKAQNALIIKERLEALNGRIPGLVKIEVGVDVSRTDASGDVVLYSEFASREALDAYQVHPEHESIKAFVTAVREKRWVGDYEV